MPKARNSNLVRTKSARRTSAATIALAGALAFGGFLHGMDRVSLTPVAPAQAQTTNKKVTDAYFESQEIYEAGDVRGALAVILRVLRDPDLEPFEKAIMFRQAANFQLELEDYPAAIRSLEGAVATGALEDTELGELYFFLGGLYLASERYDDAIAALERFFTIAESPGANAYYFLAQAYAVKERWRDALSPASKAVELSAEPNEGYLRLLVAVYINLNQWNRAVPLLEQIITQFEGKDEYWQQLAAGYQELGREKDAYAVTELRYRLGFLRRGREFVTLADLHSFYGYPYKAAKLLEDEIERGRVEDTAENLEKLGNYWLAAREFAKARQALIAASRKAPNGRLDFQIAGTFAQDEEWRQTERFLLSALNRGGLNNTQQGSAWLLLGHARNNLGKRREALTAFKRAVNYPRSKKDASTWITFLEDQFEIEAQNQLVNAIQEVLDISGQTRTAITDLELIRDVALQARETAERAQSATSDIARERALEEYRIRNREGTNRLTDQRKSAEEDAAAARSAIETARQFDLPDNDSEEIKRLEALIIERLNLVTEAENNLREAATIVEAVTGTRPATPGVPEDAQPMLDPATGDPVAEEAAGGEGEAASDGEAPAEGGDAEDAAAGEAEAEEPATEDDGA